MTTGPGALHQRVEGDLRLFGMVDVADRLGVGVRAEALDLVEGEFGAGGDDQVVVVDRRAVIEFDPVLLGMDPLRAFGAQLDAALFEDGGEIDRDVLAVAPADGDPWIRRDEGIGAAEIDDGKLVLRAQLLLHLVGHDDTAQTGAENHDARHANLPVPLLKERGSFFAFVAQSRRGCIARHQEIVVVSLGWLAHNIQIS